MLFRSPDFAGVTIPQPPGNKVVSVIVYFTDVNGCKSDSQQTNVQIFTACPPAIVSVDNSGNEYTVGSNLTKVGKVNSLEGKNLSMVSLYPNPTSGMVHLTNDFADNLNSIAIYQCDGKLIKNIESNFDLISMSEFQSGIYLFKFTMSNGASITKKIIKD